MNTSSAFKNILLIGKYRNVDMSPVLARIYSFLSSRGCQAWVQEKLVDFDLPVWDPTQGLPDLVLVVGGDGTMMGAMREWGPKGVPLAGVNYGRVGFLTDIPSDKSLEGLGSICEGRFILEERALLVSQQIEGEKIVEEMVAANDIVLGRGTSGKLVEFTLMVDNAYVYEQYADGLIISTPTGSTAYALSAGGSIIHPATRALTIVPICPQTLSNRPLVLPDTCVVDVFFAGVDKLEYFNDGERREAAQGQRLHMSLSNKRVTLIHPEGYHYFSGLRDKLGWVANR